MCRLSSSSCQPAGWRERGRAGCHHPHRCHRPGRATQHPQQPLPSGLFCAGRVILLEFPWAQSTEKPCAWSRGVGGSSCCPRKGHRGEKGHGWEVKQVALPKWREAGLHLPRWCSGPPARCQAPWDLPAAAPRDTSPLEVKRRYQELGREPRLARPGPGTRINCLHRDRSPEKQLWAQDAPKPQMSALQTRYRTQPGSLAPTFQAVPPSAPGLKAALRSEDLSGRIWAPGF